MAIVDMKKISVIGLGNDKEQIIKEIMKAGTVEISDIDMGDDSQLTEIFRKDSVKGQVTELDEKLSKVKAVIEDLSVYDTTKKGLFQSKRTISAADYKRITGDVDSILLIADEILKYNDRLSELKVQENKLNNLIETLNPWKPSNVPFDMTSTRNTVIVFGVAPATVDISDLKSNINENVPESYIQVISSDKDQHYLIIIYHCLVEEELMNALKPYGFNKVIFNEIKGTANKNIIQADHDINQIIKEREKINKIISQMAVHKAELEVVYDYLMIQKDRKEAIGKLLKSENTFVMEGWLPYDEADKLKDKILSKWDAVVEVSQAEEGEDFPILLRNHSMVKPFEMVTELYSLPKPGGVDPTAVMSIFFIIFFGLMVSDAGYGLLMAIVAGIMIKKYKLEGIAEKLIKLIFFGGISTFIWGAIFGGWFGDIIQLVTGNPNAVKPLVFNPLDDVMRLLIWSFVLGGIHLYAGMGIQAYVLIREGRYLDALFDIGFWYVLLTGIAFLFFGGVFFEIGKYMAISGAALLVLTQGRKRKGIIAKLVSGVGSLYNVTGYLSDLLSYSRLLALGLATGVIASVINTMGTLLGFNVLGIIVLVIAFVIGHVFNILINALGAYVHSSRLQYVEFFGKFYEAGGKAFKPLKINTKYIELKDREAI